jgi:hypothetical protein
MARTFNRPPLTVNTPSASDIKQYFFNQYKWKGLSSNNNFLSVDQETFSDCNNVYVDDEGLLKSRPSMKIKTVKRQNSGVEYVLSNIIDVWTFEYVTVYQTKLNNVYYLTFVNKNVSNHIQVALQYTVDGEIKTYDKVKLVIADEKIFVFSEHSFNYYDMRENIYASAEKFIHIPVVNVITDGIARSTKQLESKNILTDSYIIKYLYTSVDNINFENFVGKKVTIKIDGISYVIANFKRNNQVVFVGKYCGLSESNFTDEYIAGDYADGLPLVFVSEKESLIVCSYSYTINEITKKPTIRWSIYHTVDGITFVRLPETNDIISLPKISRDGNYCIVFKQDGPYIHSLLETDDTLKYPNWQNLLETIDSTTYHSWSIDLNQTNEIGSLFNQSRVVNGYFRDDTVFAFVYGDGLSKSGDPTYANFYCVYSRGNNSLHRNEIFSSKSGDTSYYYSSDDVKVSNVSFASSTSGSDIIRNTVRTSTNLSNITFDYVHNNIRVARAELTNLKYTQRCTYYYSGYRAFGPEWGSATFTGNLRIVDKNNNVIVDNKLSFTKDKYAPVTFPGDFSITSYNSWISEDAYFEYKISSEPIGSTTLPEGPALPYSEVLTITPKALRIDIPTSGVKVNTLAGSYFANTNALMPNVYVSYDKENSRQSILVDFAATLLNTGDNSPYYRGVFHLEYDGVEQVDFFAPILQIDDNYVRSPIMDACMINSNVYSFARVEYDGVAQNTVVYTYILSDDRLVQNATLATRAIVSTETYALTNFRKQKVILSDPFGYLITNKYFFDYTDYTSVDTVYEPINLLFEAVPMAQYNDNSKTEIYLATKTAVFSTTADAVVSVDELIEGKQNNICPSNVAVLSNYYFSEDNKLYISSPSSALHIEDNGDILKDTADFKWYFPEVNRQEFDYQITNLHVISNIDVAIFFEHSISYVNWDSDVSAYRYYKSKMQTGCKNGCDVITTYDGKYVIFTSERGLVAMTYQEFTATTEQTLTYVSDEIFSLFQNYISKKNSSNEIKLYKHQHWIFVYKQDSKKLLVFDTRTNSWWPITCLHNLTKLFTQDNELSILCNNKVFSLNKSDAAYYDYDGRNHKIEWFIKSQKLHFNAINYYKHISNITFTSVHNKTNLQSELQNTGFSDFKLQVNNYRTRVDGNINDADDYISVNYTVDSARTYVLRLNYSKINEFEYMLSSNEENATDIPLSLNSITIKYKVGSQVR